LSESALPAPSYDGLSDYEILRQKKIASNKAVMASMGLTAAVSDITSANLHHRAETVKKRGLASAKSKKRSAPVPPLRKSSRHRGEASDRLETKAVKPGAKKPTTQQLKRKSNAEDHGRPMSRTALKKQANLERKRRSDASKRSATFAGFSGGAITSQAEWMAGSGSAKKLWG
jgi:hypothetical protein